MRRLSSDEIKAIVDGLEGGPLGYAKTWGYETLARAIQDAVDAGEHADTRRIEWFFGRSPKLSFLPAYLLGVQEGWTVDQWRSAIDKCMEAT